MAKGSAKDTYANVAAVKVLESAANTFTASKFAFPFSIMDKMALLLSRIEYWIGDMGILNSSGDALVVGVGTASSISDVSNQADPQIIDSASFGRFDMGTAASGTFFSNPFIKDFSDLPGQGILVAPSPLYGWVKGTGAASAATVWVKLFYTYSELATDEYWQLVESRRIISN